MATPLQVPRLFGRYCNLPEGWPQSATTLQVPECLENIATPKRGGHRVPPLQFRALRLNKKTVMKCYRSFLIRCWVIEDLPLSEKKIIDVEHIQSGERTRVAEMSEAEEWMFAVTRKATAGFESGAGKARIRRDAGDST